MKIFQKWVHLSSLVVTMLIACHKHVDSNDADGNPKEACEQIQKVLVHRVGGDIGKEVEEGDDADGEEQPTPALVHVDRKVAEPAQGDEVI